MTKGAICDTQHQSTCPLIIDLRLFKRIIRPARPTYTSKEPQRLSQHSLAQLSHCLLPPANHPYQHTSDPGIWSLLAGFARGGVSYLQLRFTGLLGCCSGLVWYGLGGVDHLDSRPPPNMLIFGGCEVGDVGGWGEAFKNSLICRLWNVVTLGLAPRIQNLFQ